MRYKLRYLLIVLRKVSNKVSILTLFVLRIFFVYIIDLVVIETLLYLIVILIFIKIGLSFYTVIAIKVIIILNSSSLYK